MCICVCNQLCVCVNFICSATVNVCVCVCVCVSVCVRFAGQQEVVRGIFCSWLSFRDSVSYVAQIWPWYVTLWDLATYVLS